VSGEISEIRPPRASSEERLRRQPQAFCVSGRPLRWVADRGRVCDGRLFHTGMINAFVKPRQCDNKSL